MRKFLLRLLSEDKAPEIFDITLIKHVDRLLDLEKRVQDLEQLVAADKADKPQVRKRIVTRTMSDYRQAMGDEEIHVPQG